MTIVRRLFEIQEQKVDLTIDTLQQIAHLFNSHVYELSDNIKEEYIEIAEKFIKEYQELIGKEEEGYGEIQENEQN
jgi:hypothetical protein